MGNTMIPTEKDTTKPQHWSFEQWCLVHLGWFYNARLGFYSEESGAVHHHDVMSVEHNWKKATLIAWRRGEPIHVDAIRWFKEQGSPTYNNLMHDSNVNGTWVVIKGELL